MGQIVYFGFQSVRHEILQIGLSDLVSCFTALRSEVCTEVGDLGILLKVTSERSIYSGYVFISIKFKY